MKKQANWNILKNFRKKASADALSDRKEYLMIALEWLLADAAVSCIFYRSMIAFAVMMPAGILFFKMKMKDIQDKRRKELAGQFRESIMAVCAALNAGYSVENSFSEAYRDMIQMYGRESQIAKQYMVIHERLKNNETLERILSDFADDSGIEDIRDFADVFSAAKRSGGDMVKIIKRAAGNISDKIDVKREIDTIMSAKRFEQRIMEIVPFAIIAYLGISSPGFLDTLYHNPMGIGIMTFSLILYGAGFYLAEKIIRIDV